MGKYSEILKTTDEIELNAMLENGWELISVENKAITNYDYGVSGITDISIYVIGLSYKVLSENFKGIINLYESKGLKENIFNEIEIDLDDSLHNYSSKSWNIFAEVTEFTEAINNYEYWTSDLTKLKKMYIKQDNESDISFDEELFPF